MHCHSECKAFVYPQAALCSRIEKVSGQDRDSGWQQRATLILQTTMDHPEAFAFVGEVEWESLELTDYPKIVPVPMDLAKVERNLENRKYATMEDFVRDVRLTFTNAKMYNDKEARIFSMAMAVSECFEKTLKAQDFCERCDDCVIRRVPRDHPTIQSAIDSSCNGDVIQISPGTYKENLLIKDKALSIEGIDSKHGVLIVGDVNTAMPTVTCVGVTSDIQLSNLTILKADQFSTKGTEGRGAILCERGAKVRVSRCDISSKHGCGVYVQCLQKVDQDTPSTLYICDCNIHGCELFGMKVSYTAKAIVKQCTIAYNKKGGLCLHDGGDLVVCDSNIHSNLEHAVLVKKPDREEDYAKITIKNNRIWENKDGKQGLPGCPLPPRLGMATRRQ